MTTRYPTIARGLVAFVGPLIVTGMATARPGDLDTTFSEDGRVFVDVATDSDLAAGVLQQPDGKLVVGRYNSATNDDFSVLRFNADGSADAAFNGRGRTTVDFPGVKGTTHVVLRQADGRIVAAGTTGNAADSLQRNFGLARYNEDGSVDTTFGAGGIVIHDLGGGADTITSIIQQDDGRLVAAGVTDGGPSGTPDMAFARFNTDGSLDRSFGTNGVVIVNFHDSNGHDDVRGLARQVGGTLVATGIATPSNPYSHQDMAVVRLLPDGQADATFGGDGRATVELVDRSGQGAGNIAEAYALAAEADGGIVVAGNGNTNIWDYGLGEPILARLNIDGSADTTFVDGGTAWIDLSGAYLQGVVAEPDGPIYLTGDYNGDHFVARVTRAGELDASFGVDGVAIIESADGNAHDNAGSASLIRQFDGKIVTVSSTTAGDASPGAERIVVARLLVGDAGGHPGVLGFYSSITAEENQTIQVPIRRTGGSLGTVSVDFAATSGSATSAADFDAASGTLTWNDGATTDQTIEIRIAADSVDEGGEDFRIELSNPSGGASLAASQLTVQIAANGAPPSSPPPPGPASGGSGYGGGGGAIDWMSLAGLLAVCLPGALPLVRRRIRWARV